MDGNILMELDEFKVPALIEAGVTIGKPIIVLISRAGGPDASDRTSGSAASSVAS